MNRGIGIALILIGVLLLVFGFQEARSLESDVHRFFTGSPTDRSMWLLIGGAVAAILGVFFILSRPKS